MSNSIISSDNFFIFTNLDFQDYETGGGGGGVKGQQLA